VNIKNELLREHSNWQAEKIARYACLSKKNFKELVKCFLSDNNLLAQRAAWSLGKAGSRNPALILAHLPDLIKILERNDVHIALIRNALMILEKTELPIKFQGKITQLCFQFLESGESPPSVKAYSITILHNLSHHYQEILPELRSIVEHRLEFESPAFKVRARKILE